MPARTGIRLIHVVSTGTIRRKGVPYMSENNNSGNPVFRLDISGAAVMVRFSDTETADVKERIRDILTESYEERFQRSIQECVQLV